MGIWTKGGIQLKCSKCNKQWTEPEIDYVPIGDSLRKDWEQKNFGVFWKCPQCGEPEYKVKKQ